MREAAPQKTPVPLLLKVPPRDAGAELEESDAATKADDGEGGLHYLCRACRQRIAPKSAETPVHGKIRHTFFNPHGLLFRIVCLKTAPGASGVGAETSEFTWFPGYAWRICVCSVCRAHLGWSYSGNSEFFGLIEDALVETTDDSA